MKKQKENPLFKRENLAIVIAVMSFLFWILQNMYFGWNEQPMSALEGFCDALSMFGYFMAFLVKPVSNDRTRNYILYGGDLKIGNE